jgi:hypothetical protein
MFMMHIVINILCSLYISLLAAPPPDDLLVTLLNRDGFLVVKGEVIRLGAS